MLPTIDFCGHKVTRLICGGNPLSGFSHVSDELDEEMVSYYTMPNIQACLAECWRQGVNTLQSRGDRHQMRVLLEHRQGGGQLQWIAQTATEWASIAANVAMIARHGPIGIYNHGTHTDNCWHEGRMDVVLDIVKAIKDQYVPAGLGTHIPEVIKYAEEHDWPTDFYMGCFYNLARGYKAAPAAERDAYAKDKWSKEDPAKMTKVLRAVPKPCLGFKILAAGRTASTPESTREAFRLAFDSLKPTDAVVVGVFQKHSNQLAENAAIVREIL